MRLRDEYDRLRLLRCLLREGEREISEGVKDRARPAPRLGGVRRSLLLPESLSGGVRDRLGENCRRRAVRERDCERDLDREDAVYDEYEE